MKKSNFGVKLQQTCIFSFDLELIPILENKIFGTLLAKCYGFSGLGEVVILNSAIYVYAYKFLNLLVWKYKSREFSFSFFLFAWKVKVRIKHINWIIVLRN